MSSDRIAVKEEDESLDGEYELIHPVDEMDPAMATYFKHTGLNKVLLQNIPAEEDTVDPKTKAVRRSVRYGGPYDTSDGGRGYQIGFGTILTCILAQVRLPLQASPDRRLGCRQVLLAAPFRRRHLHRELHLHHRCRLRELPVARVNWPAPSDHAYRKSALLSSMARL